MTQHSDYALRLLIHLGLAGPRLVTAEEVARTFNLSKNHLMKVILGLVRHGYLQSVRGRSGGIRLARQPGEITVGAVIRDMEDGFALVECMGPGNACIISNCCRLRGVMHEALAAYLRVLDGYSLADLVAQPGPLWQILGLQPVPAPLPHA